MRPQVRYEDLKDLLIEENQDGNMLQCRFRCSLSGEEATAQVQIRVQETSLVKRAQERAQRQVWHTIRSRILRWLRHNLGLGRMVDLIARDALDSAYDMTQNMYTEDELHAAAVRAFAQVEGKFRYDDSLGRYVATGTFD